MMAAVVLLLYLLYIFGFSVESFGFCVVSTDGVCGGGGSRLDSSKNLVKISFSGYSA